MINNYKQIFSKEQIMTILKSGIKKNANSNNKIRAKSLSAYGQKLRESKKISLFYGDLSKKYLQKINNKSLKEPSKLSENIFIILESRLDVVLYRSGFFESIKSAKQMVRIGGIKVNNKIVISPGYFVIPGDILSVFGKNNKKKLCSAIDQKNVFFVNRRHSKKNINSKEKIDICKTFSKMKNQILTRNSVGSRYKGSQMLLSTISLAFGYSQKLRAYKNNISNNNCAKNKILQPILSFKSAITKAKKTQVMEDFTIAKGNSSTIVESASRNRSCTLREKGYPFNIEKDNGFGLCLIFINTIKSLINFKDLTKSYNDQSQKTVAFLNRLTEFNNDIKISNLYIFTLEHLVTEKLAKSNIHYDNFWRNSGRFTNLVTEDENTEMLSSSINQNKQHMLKTEDNKRALKYNKNTVQTKGKTKSKALINKFFNVDSPDFLFMFLNYLLNLKKQYSFLQKKKINYKKQQQSLFFKNQNFFEMKKTKVPHLEVSYKSLSIIFLFPPQRVNFPFFFNPSLIYK